MITNTFRDSLMLVHFDEFKELLYEIEDIKAQQKTLNRRVKKPVCTYTAYQMLKQIAEPLRRIFNSRKYSHQTCVDKFTDALRKLHLLIRELVDYGRDTLANTLEHLYQRLFALLPEQTVIQHELFDADKYETPYKKHPSTKSFIQWLQDYHLLGYFRRDIARRYAVVPVRVVQHSIRFSQAGN